MEGFWLGDKFWIIAVIPHPKTSFVFNNKGRALADPALGIFQERIAG
jgi:hypothetical protein